MKHSFKFRKMNRLDRKYWVIKHVSRILIVATLLQIVVPLQTKALTTGPSQPEVMQFQQAGTSGMVDPFTGAFNYNIPLFELPGPNGSYPFNLAYQSGVTMDQEASWVGLGWSLNPGAITRTMRGLPDEFDGDAVSIKQDLKEDWTVGVGLKGNFELFGADLADGLVGGLPFGITIYYNSYMGFGYSLDGGFTMVGGGKDGGNAMLAGAGLNVSLDSQDGVGLDPSFNLGRQQKVDQQIFSLGMGYSSRRGMTDISLGYTKRQNVKLPEGETNPLSFRNLGSYLPSATAFTPILDKEMTGSSANFTFKLGFSIFGADPNATMSGFYRRNHLGWDTKDIESFGYLNLHKANKSDMLDLNREGDGVLRKETKNLASPILTNDVYQISGQGIGGGFRAWRNDVPIVGNREAHSGSTNFSWGLELNPTKFALDFSLGNSNGNSGYWGNRNEVVSSTDPNAYGYHSLSNYAKDYEPWYFKSMGDLRTDFANDLDYLHGTGPVRLSMGLEDTDRGKRAKILEKLENRDGDEIAGLLPRESYATNPHRRARNTVISYVKNAELNAASDNLGEYDVKHYETNTTPYSTGHSAPTHDLIRSAPGHHFAGMSVDQTDGLRYVYALPARNLKQVESLFSVNGSPYPCDQIIPTPSLSGGDVDYKVSNTDKSIHKTTIPEHAHSYMLTSVLGQDYVDADDVKGPSDGDLGYWVKFNYVKIADAYKWRAPFAGVNLAKGNLSTKFDDKGNYMYGEREQWYLASAETKTHIAEFSISHRNDNRGVSSEFQAASSSLGAYTYKLDKIELYSKEDLLTGNSATPITRVSFDYGYSLCPNVTNGSSGKLTLQRVKFSHENSTRGESQNPYEFTYGSNNPPYSNYDQDKWGNFRPSGTCANRNYPYVDQTTSRTALDDQGSAWHLTEIQLPTGGTMQVDYEANDYAYVQNKPAMEMYKVAGLGSVGNTMVYNANYDESSQYAGQRTVIVDLGRNIYSQNELDRIMEGVDQVYIKTLIDLKASNHNVREYVGAYLDVESYDKGCNTPFSSGCSMIKIVLKPCTWNNGKLDKYHPMAVAAWTYLRTNLPELMSIPGFSNANQTDPGSNRMAIRQKAKSLASIGPELVRVFAGYYKHARISNWGQYFDPSQTWVRLNHLEGKKVGGGCRVKQITLDDEFGNNGENVVTGVVYDYTMQEDGRTISSGVAAYEPMLGGDENPLRKAKRFQQHTPLNSSLSLFSQLPVNESYMPSPTIGYRRVTVKSLATQKVIDGLLAATIPTTGAAVHEFWTAKDFPVEFDETECTPFRFNLPIPIPLVGMLHFNQLAATQGYSIVLNDMHGRPKQVSNYGQDKNGQLESNPISRVEYEYDQTVIAPGTSSEKRRLKNLVNTIVFDVDGSDPTKSLVQQRVLGQEHEFFVDMRENGTDNFGMGTASNLDIIFAGAWPSLFPSINAANTLVRTCVTNKIVHQSGVLIGTKTYNQGSLVKTDNLLFDSQTARPLLTRITNDFDRPIYSYEYPAFWAYDQMGPAYKNIGIEFASTMITSIGNQYYGVTGGGVGSAYENIWVPGDELIVTSISGSPAKAWFVGFSAGNLIIYSEDALSNGPAEIRIYRSGRRNLVHTSAEQIVSLRNPTENRGNLLCWRDVQNPTVELSTNTSTTTVTDILVPRPCITNFIANLSTFLSYPSTNIYNQTVYPYRTNWGCGDCLVQSLAANSNNDITIECTPNCTVSIRDLQGIKIDPTQIAYINYSGVVSTGPVLPYTSPLGPFGIKLDVYMDNNTIPVVGYLDGCPDLFEDGFEVVPQEVTTYSSTFNQTPQAGQLGTTMFMIDSVLSATATTFSEAWMQDFSDVRFPDGNAGQLLADLDVMYGYANGQRGVWKPKDSYVYVADRRQSNEVNTKQDGTFSGVPMFDFQGITFDYCASNWRKVSEVTRYSPYGFELENRDVLGVYSAALYGYNGKLPTAVGSNSDYREIGFESFEEYGATADLLALSSGNLDFPTDFAATPPRIWSYTDTKLGSLDQFFYLDGTLTQSILIHPITTSGTKSMVQGRTHGDSPFNRSIHFGEGQGIVNMTLTQVELPTRPYLHNAAAAPQYHRGRVVYQRPTLAQTMQQAPSRLEYWDQKAHTGKKSLALKGVVEFAQNRLKLKEGEAYTLQLWVSRDVTDVHTYHNTGNVSQSSQLGVVVKFYDQGGALISSLQPFRPKGELVEGWQKIEGNFDVPSNTENIAFVLNSGKIGTNTDFVDTYFDDIRLQPLKSKMTCYVYDPSNYKLRATLDDDNFALIYHYDEAGNLHLVQKETVEGIRTVQESRGFLAE